MKTVVFQIITHLEMGGAERIAFNIAKSKSKEFEYHIVEVARGNSAYTKEMIKELESCNIQYHRSNISSNKKAIILFPFRLKNYMININRVQYIPIQRFQICRYSFSQKFSLRQNLN